MKKSNSDCIEPSTLSWPFCGKTILWLAGSNKYILAEEPAALVIRRIEAREENSTIIRFCTEVFNISQELAETLINEIRQSFHEVIESPCCKDKMELQTSQPIFASTKYYLIYGFSFIVEYETIEAELLIHSKFEYLEVANVPNPDHHFQVLSSENECSLYVDGIHIGTWGVADRHFLSGKFSMLVLQKIYQKEEDDWMGVFHAAGISDGKNCLMFLGDSGNGKSTSSAILMANGLEVLSDDFLPIESKSLLVCHFPGAISIKEKAYALLTPLFPQLLQSKEINNPLAGKTFRHLPSDRVEPICVPCKALIFVKFEKDAGFLFEIISGEEAFKHLVPDSWISPTSENANRFVKWFTSLPYYRLVYSDNEQMVQMVKKILNDDL